MQIVIEISNKDIPKHQEVIDIHLHFIDGHIVDADGYGFMEIPKGHGDLIDRKELLENKYEIDSMYCEYDEVVNVDDIKDAPTIIEADKER